MAYSNIETLQMMTSSPIHINGCTSEEKARYLSKYHTGIRMPPVKENRRKHVKENVCRIPLFYKKRNVEYSLIMQTKGNFMINLSVLYRNTQKFFDRVMMEYGLGWGQGLFLFFINENEGCTMQEVTKISEVDKGTTTKAIQKLQEQGYVVVQQDSKDKRVRRLYTTEKAVSIMNTLYAFRNVYRTQMFEGIDSAQFEEELDKICQRSKTLSDAIEVTPPLRIGKFTKFSVREFPGRTSAVVYMSGCNLKCPYCYVSDLVFVPENAGCISQEEVLHYLQRRKTQLDGVVITGGEPCLQEGLLPFMEQVHRLGYRVRLETNGCYPEVLQACIDTGAVDEVVLDYKAGKGKMKFLTGANTASVMESLAILKNSDVYYEVCTTLIKELHTAKEMETMAKELQGIPVYVLRNYQDGDTVISRIYHPLSEEELQKRKEIAQQYISRVEIRR